MGKILISILLGTSLVILSITLFGSGLISRFFEVSAIMTDTSHVHALVDGGADASKDVATVITFAAEVFAYYAGAAILVFVFDLFMPGKKKDGKRRR